MKPLSYYTEEREKSDIAMETWIRFDIDADNENEDPMFGFTSIIMDAQGDPTETLTSDNEYVEQLEGQVPNIYPNGWNSKQLIEERISTKYMIDALKNNIDVADNWNLIIKKLRERKNNTPHGVDTSPIVLPANNDPMGLDIQNLEEEPLNAANINLEIGEEDETNNSESKMREDFKNTQENANTTNPDEYMKLAEKYAKGLGTDVDKEKAKINYDMAKSLGSEMVIEGLEELIE
jgi:hypothetical protein